MNFSELFNKLQLSCKYFERERKIQDTTNNTGSSFWALFSDSNPVMIQLFSVSFTGWKADYSSVNYFWINNVCLLVNLNLLGPKQKDTWFTLDLLSVDVFKLPTEHSAWKLTKPFPDNTDTENFTQQKYFKAWRKIWVAPENKGSLQNKFRFYKTTWNAFVST